MLGDRPWGRFPGMLNSSSLGKQQGLLLLAPAQKAGNVWSGDSISFHFFEVIKAFPMSAALPSLPQTRQLRPQCPRIRGKQQ